MRVWITQVADHLRVPERQGQLHEGDRKSASGSTVGMAIIHELSHARIVLLFTPFIFQTSFPRKSSQH